MDCLFIFVAYFSIEFFVFLIRSVCVCYRQYSLMILDFEIFSISYHLFANFVCRSAVGWVLSSKSSCLPGTLECDLIWKESLLM